LDITSITMPRRQPMQSIERTDFFQRTLADKHVASRHSFDH
jgi:hypothetical protein